MGMFDLFREDSKYPGWDFLIGFVGMFLFFATFGLNLGFGSFSHWLLQGTPDYVGVVKITLLTAILKDWFYFVLMVLGIFLITFGTEKGHSVGGVVSIINKAFIFIGLFFKSKKGKRITLFSLSVILWIISILVFYSIGDRESFLKDITQHFFVTMISLVMIAITTSMMFFVALSVDDVLFKKLW